MLLTEKFVFIHLPKTGGTFVREMVGRLYGKGEVRDHIDLQRNPPDLKTSFFIMAQFSHASRKVIPDAFADLPVFGCVRNPLDRYLSQYRYGSWKVADNHLYPGIREHPGFPEITFSEYVELANKKLWLFEEPKFLLEQSIGWQTACFIKWFCRKELLDLLASGATLTVEMLRTFSYPVRFLHTRRLNEDLYNALYDVGYDSKDIDFIRNAPKVLPDQSKRSGENDIFQSASSGSEYFQPEVEKVIREKERLLFELFPEWDNAED